jgi:AcrR family transcriptional regulator
VTLGTLPPTGLTARRKERIRRELAEAAASLFYERGYDGTTVEDIAAAVEVSPRTVYRYFATKDELIVALGQSNSDAFLAALRARPTTESPTVAVRAAVTSALAPNWRESAWRVRAFLTLIRETPVLRARWVEEAYDAQRRLAAVLGERNGTAGSDLRNLVAAGAITLAINTALQEWAGQTEVKTPEGSVDDALALLAGPLL